ncbi:tyrosine-type recombinase/integrase [Symbiopectobacterium purcellii]|uniref:Phage integrase Arm DNA-binding domain-containing protein n=1 Tax=Symbiopectobacterium purcellii TaxID=2871826 RepID=A0ABX9AMV9_9ENTR|nr:tyrosine-type recombinase/integrase [Symbiopectobacterium purcellii]QZN96342.1 phage integrase Arm DNA-binding domain-containing protein [Symbiopectobacterium purcellii]QZN96401.1 phage integrase Arm DNA-binding domain-containing protein [Symbiopectobacterium purcellii]QZN96421.1 phage integrase Arm DNA-binding domain-containing protein [Symbiopectobacterium purcellii]QZN96459.1 phage integrase Arm DNA-binding domain-containing protein [Symbiopectobacterium purcellii]
MPPNLQPRNGGYFCYRDPRTGKEYGLGRHRQGAITQAIAANMAIYGSSKPSPLVDRINDTQVTTVSEWTERYLRILEGRKLKPKTMSEYNKYLKAVNAHLGEFAIQQVETKDIASFLHQWVKEGKVTMANCIRALLRDLFREAIAEGLLKSNPAEATRNQRINIQRGRITLDAWKVIRKAADRLPAWVGPCLDLALVTGQRLGDIQALCWEDLKDGRLYIKQAKTGMMLAFSQTTRIDCLNLCLADVLNQFRKLNNGIAHIVANTKYKQFAAKTISAAFLKARRISGLTWERKPPSFHEIRSLAARLYTDEKGRDYAQKLLGHKSSEMTDKYRNVRGAEWTEIE